MFAKRRREINSQLTGEVYHVPNDAPDVVVELQIKFTNLNLRQPLCQTKERNLTCAVCSKLTGEGTERRTDRGTSRPTVLSRVPNEGEKSGVCVRSNSQFEFTTYRTTHRTWNFAANRVVETKERNLTCAVCSKQLTGQVYHVETQKIKPCCRKREREKINLEKGNTCKCEWGGLHVTTVTVGTLKTNVGVWEVS